MTVNFPAPVNVTRDPSLDHERLEVYQRALEFHAQACTLVAARGLRILRDQLERASLGVALCIAEGAGRTSQPDRARDLVLRLVQMLSRLCAPPRGPSGEAVKKALIRDV
jgi:23S rRNA-intervening sequence protein